MLVKIGPYINRWISQIHTDYMNKKYNYRWDDNHTRFETFLEKLEDTLQWIYNHTVNLYLDRKERTVKVKIHSYDTWGMDDTLAHVIVPMLKQLKETKHGAPNVDWGDVPEELRPTRKEINAYKKDGATDNKFFERWDWVMNEMIFAFESKLYDWDDQYFGDWIDDDTKALGGYHTTVDWDGMKAHQKRISNGFRLFGKYYESLWD